MLYKNRDKRETFACNRWVSV